MGVKMVITKIKSADSKAKDCFKEIFFATLWYGGRLWYIDYGASSHILATILANILYNSAFENDSSKVIK
jgi:hypothetical protein